VLVWLFHGAFPRGGPVNRKVIRDIFAAGAAVVVLTGLAYSPVLVAGSGLVEAQNVKSGMEVFTPLPVSDLLDTAVDNLVAVWISWNYGIPLPLTLILVAGVVASIVLHRKISTHPPLLPAMVVWCAIVVSLHRVVPHTRVMQVFLPVYAILAAAGLAALWQRFRPSPGRTPVPLAGLAVLLAAGLAYNQHRTQYPAIDNVRVAPGALRNSLPVADIEGVFAKVEQRLRAGHRIYATGASTYPLLYYCRRNRIPADRVITSNRYRLWPLAESTETLFVVLYVRPFGIAEDRDLAHHLKHAPDIWDPSAAHLVASFDSALLYEVPKR
jgi:hypothetical protein